MYNLFLHMNLGLLIFCHVQVSENSYYYFTEQNIHILKQ